MKPEEILQIIADSQNLKIEGKGKKMCAVGEILKFPVVARVDSSFLMKELVIVFATAAPVSIKKLDKLLDSHKPKGMKPNAFFVTDVNNAKGAAIAGILGGAIGGAIYGALTAKNSGEAFELHMVMLGKSQGEEIRERFNLAISALEDAAKQLEVVPVSS